MSKSSRLMLAVPPGSWMYIGLALPIAMCGLY
eukprot:SAG31_NODE_15098_length_771_cov_0.997024_2_plen_31_part_01